MTPEQAKEILPVIQAIADGKRVQVKTDMWIDMPENMQIHSNYKYRVKPEPLKAWLLFFRKGDRFDMISFGRKPDLKKFNLPVIAITEVTVEEGEGL